MASRKIADLHPSIKPLCLAFIGRCAEEGVPVMLTCTYRSWEEQDALYAQGRTAPGRIVTKVRGGRSKHNFTIDDKPAAKAFDVAVLKDGKPIWDLKASVDGDAIPDYKEIAEIGRKLGLKPGFDFGDPPHFELKE